MEYLGKLLIVDDDESLCKYLNENLRAYFDIRICHDGQAGYDTAVKFRPDLIISDVRMPVLSGINMLKRIRRTKGLETVAIIFLSILDKREDRILGYESMADIYFTKPFDMAELTSASIGLVRMRQQLRAQYSSPEEIETLGPGLSDDDQRFLALLSDVVQSRISDSSLTVDEVAKTIHVSRRQLERRLKQLEGITPAEYIRQVRLEVARQMLEGGRINSLKVLANWVGFRDVRTFTSRYNSHFGFPPKV